MKNLINEITRVTRKGPVTKWSDRLGMLADIAGIRMDLINWYASPRDVIMQIVRYAENNDSVEDLREGIKQYEIENNS